VKLGAAPKKSTLSVSHFLDFAGEGSVLSVIVQSF
jgi:hypothetical protein